MVKKKNNKDIKTYLRTENWLSAASIDRKFVMYPNPGCSPGKYFRFQLDNNRIKLSVIIPTSDAYRGGYFLKLLSQIKVQDFPDYELIAVRGDPRQGRAINIGAELSKGKYILTLDDDTSLPDPETFKKLVSVMEKHPEIGIAGGNNVVPKYASSFVRRVMTEIPRRSWKPVQLITDSDLAEHPCIIMRTDEFKVIGGENELIPRGLDPYLREEFRKAGKRVVIVPDVVYHHLPPDTFSRLVRQFYRNGKQAAFTNRNYPQWVIETPKTHGRFESQKPFGFRMIRFPFRLLEAIVRLRFIFLIAEIAYAVGFIVDWVKDGK